MIDIKKITKLENNIKKNKDRLLLEKDFKKKEILKLKISIDQLKIKIERMKL